MNDPHPDARTGFMAAFAAYSIWGILPLYLKLVGFANPWEILGSRILWSIPACIVGVLLMGGFAETRKAAAQPGVLPALALSSLFIAGNWAIYVWAVANDHVIEASLAYVLTPLVNIAFGVTLFGERLTRLQDQLNATGSTLKVWRRLTQSREKWPPQAGVDEGEANL